MGIAEPQAEQIMRDLLQQVRGVPGVERAAIANADLLSGGWPAAP